MKGSRFSEEQIIGVLREHEAGSKTEEVCRRHGLSQRHACRLVDLDRSTLRYQGQRPDDAALRQRLRELAGERRRFGYRRLGWMLAREGHALNHKRLYRLYREERLMVRRRGRRKRALGTRAPIRLPRAINQRWSLDFVSDTLSDGRRFRILCVVDDFSRGVFERFPKLKIVSAENDVGWLPHYMYRLDHGFEKFGAMMEEPLPMKPSDYIRRQLYATFQDDPVGPAAYKLFGPANYMWASDFPHTDSTWPESRKVVERDFAGVPDEVTRKIVFENAVALYHIDV
jgi:hypothetical protein